MTARETDEWVIRVSVPENRDRTQLTAVVTEALTELGLTVRGLAYPFELNARPQRPPTRRVGEDSS